MNTNSLSCTYNTFIRNIFLFILGCFSMLFFTCWSYMAEIQIGFFVRVSNLYEGYCVCTWAQMSRWGIYLFHVYFVMVVCFEFFLTWPFLGQSMVIGCLLFTLLSDIKFILSLQGPQILPPKNWPNNRQLGTR